MLEPLSRDVARAIVTGDLSGVRAAQDWPHADTLDGIRLALDRDAEPGWLVTRDGLVIGDCGTFGPADDNGEVEIGYGLAASHRGHGYGKEMVAGLSSWLLEQPGIRSVRARTAPDNVASRRVLELAGFEQVAETAENLTYVRHN